MAQIDEKDRAKMLSMALLLESPESPSARFERNMRCAVAAELRLLVAKYGGVPKSRQ